MRSNYKNVTSNYEWKNELILSVQGGFDIVTVRNPEPPREPPQSTRYVFKSLTN